MRPWPPLAHDATCRSLPASAPVGFTIVTGATTFSPVKTNLVDARVKSTKGEPTYSAASGEADAYLSGCEMLRVAGVELPAAATVSMSGVSVALGPRVVIDPSFAVGVAAWREKLPTPSAVRLSASSTLLLQGDLRGLRIESLDLDGALVVRLCAGAKLTIKHANAKNSGWAFEPLADGETDEALTIRGYRLVKHAQREIVFDTPGEYVVNDA